jgi:hypothetical protein
VLGLLAKKLIIEQKVKMGRKKIRIQPISDLRNRQVSVPSKGLSVTVANFVAR